MTAEFRDQMRDLLQKLDETSKSLLAVLESFVRLAEISPKLDRSMSLPPDDEIKELLIKAATSIPAGARGKVLTRLDLIKQARSHGLIEELVGTAKRPLMDATANKRFGKMMLVWRGRELVDEKGRAFVVAHHRKKTGATYPLRFIRDTERKGR